MKQYLVSAAFIAIVVATTPTMAATIVGDTTISGVTLDFGAQPPLTDKVKNNAAPDGTTITLRGSASDTPIDYIAPTILEASGNNGDGFSFVSGPGNGANEQGFASLIIDPQGVGVGFSAINFNLMPLGSGNHTWYADIVLNLVGGGSPISFQNVAFDTNGQNKFAIYSDDNRLFSSISFADLRTMADGGDAKNFDSMREVSIELGGGVSPIPEPAAWALMMAGFGLAGGAIRRRAKTNMCFA